MPYDPVLDGRIRAVTGTWPGAGSKKMFGGVCHLLGDHMVCGVYKDLLILRLGEAAAGAALQKPHVRPFDITGRPMKGWVMVEPEGCGDADRLADWLEQARQFAATLK